MNTSWAHHVEKRTKVWGRHTHTHTFTLATHTHKQNITHTFSRPKADHITRKQIIGLRGRVKC